MNTNAQFDSGENKKDKKVSGKLMFSYVWFTGENYGPSTVPLDPLNLFLSKLRRKLNKNNS